METQNPSARTSFIVQHIGRILGGVAFVDIIAADPVGALGGDPARDGRPGAQRNADQCQVPAVAQVVLGETPTVGIHVLGQANGVGGAALPYGLHQQLFLAVAVAMGAFVVLFLFLQHKVNLLLADAASILIDDAVQLQQLLVFKADVFQHGIGQQDHVADLRQCKDLQCRNTAVLNAIGAGHLPAPGRREPLMAHGPHVQESILCVQAREPAIIVGAMDKRRTLSGRSLPEQMAKLTRLHQRAFRHRVEKGRQRAVRSFVDHFHLQHAAKYANVILPHQIASMVTL